MPNRLAFKEEKKKKENPAKKKKTRVYTIEKRNKNKQNAH